MMFKNESTVFLDKMVEMRNAATETAVAEAIAKEHIPYVTELTAQKYKLIAEAKAQYERDVATLAAVLQGKINQYTTETETAISAHKTKVVTAAENDLRAKFDKFILGVSSLVDDAGIE